MRSQVVKELIKKGLYCVLFYGILCIERGETKMQIKTKWLREEINWDSRTQMECENGFAILKTLLTNKSMCIPCLEMGSRECIIFELEFKDGNDYKDFKNELCQMGYVKEDYDICDLGIRYSEFHSYRGSERYLAKKVNLVNSTDFINTSYRIIITPF